MNEARVLGVESYNQTLRSVDQSGQPHFALCSSVTTSERSTASGITTGMIGTTEGKKWILW